MNISDTTCHQITIQFPPYPTFVYVLPGETQPAKYHFLFNAIRLLN